MSTYVVWWTHDNLAALWSWLDENGLDPADGPAYFMEKPWKWNLEYDAMIHSVHGKAPLNSSPEDVLKFLNDHNLPTGENGQL